MRPGDRDIDDEIRGHLALAIQERIERGEDPESARLAALREFGYVPAVRDSMRRVWYSRALDTAASFAQDLRIGLRSLLRAKWMVATVVVTLALGIGANAAVVSVVRGVLLRPLGNRGESRLVYVRQSAPGLGAANITFSMPEIEDLRARGAAIAAFGDFSTIDFTLLGLGEPRQVQAGVVSGSYFEVMGLRPVHGRLLNPGDDGPDAAGAAVLTHRFWSTALNGDPSVVGRTIRLGAGRATIVGVLEPSVPYPADTEIIANVVTSPHHLEATMVAGRTHRMTQLFGRLAPGVPLEQARADLVEAHAAMMREHPEAYPASAAIRLTVTPLRDAITAPARTVLFVLLGAAGLVFIIACSNVANLILARSVRRGGELAVRAALGASRGALRRTLLAESLVLCGAGAVLGVLLARPLVRVIAQYASRFSVRALEVTVDATLLWTGAVLALAAAVVLAYIPRLPGPHASRFAASWSGRRRGFRGSWPGLPPGGLRLTPGTNRRLRIFATAQIAFTFVLLAGAGTLLASLAALQAPLPNLDIRRVLAFDLPTPSIAILDAREMDFYQEVTRRIDALPGVDGAALGIMVPWRDAGALPRFQFAVEGAMHGAEHPHARFRVVAPGFFDVLGIPMLAGRDFTDRDESGGESVVIVSESLARRFFPDGNAVNRRLRWTDALFQGFGSCRIVGIVKDLDDENVEQGPALTIYHPVRQTRAAGRLFVRAAGDPYAAVPAIRQVVREMSAEQPVERAATLEDVRAGVLAPERLQTFVVAGFAGVALLIAVVGVAGVLAFEVSARTRELGVHLALGATPRRMLARVLLDGALIAGAGIAAGAVGACALALGAAAHIDGLHAPGALPLSAAGAVLAIAAVLAALLPAARAARVDVLQALGSE